MIRLSCLGIGILLLSVTACGGGGSDNSAPPKLLLSTANLPTARVGVSVSDALMASGGTPPYTWAVASGALPAGITLSATGLLTGTPTAAGTSTAVLQVTDSGRPVQSATQSLPWAVLPPSLVIASTSLPPAGTNTGYSTMLTASGGTPPYTWTITSGALPTGFRLSAAGEITGSTAQPTTAALQITVSDAGEPAQTATQALSLTVAASPLSIGTATLGTATANVVYAQSLTAAGGIGSYVWSLQAGALPTGIALTGGTLSGTPTAPGIASVVLSVSDGASPANTAQRTYNLLVAAAGAPVQVALAATPSNLTIGNGFAVLSYEKAMLSKPLFGPADTTLIALFDRLGPGLLRIGGNSVDHSLWNPTGPGETPDQVSPVDVARLAGFLEATHWKVLYGIEFLNEAATPVTTTAPDLVAAEAVNVMEALGDNLYGFEIGNEPDLYDNQIPGFTYADFQAQWQTYRSAILSAVAAAKATGALPPSANPVFTGPAAAYNDAGYLAPFASAQAQDVALLTRHYYIANGQSATSTMNLMLTPDPNLPPLLGFMASTAAGAKIASGYRISEANSFYNGGAPGISDGYGSSLWAINFLFTNAWAGSTGVNFHGGGDGPGYTPIADNGSAVVEARPEYYGIYLFSLAGNGALVATTTTPATSSFYAYAVAATGATKIVLVNTSATTAINAAIHFDMPASGASFVTLTGPSLVSTTGQLLSGAPITAGGGWAPVLSPKLPVVSGQLIVPVPAGSAILMTVQ